MGHILCAVNEMILMEQLELYQKRRKSLLVSGMCWHELICWGWRRTDGPTTIGLNWNWGAVWAMLGINTVTNISGRRVKARWCHRWMRLRSGKAGSGGGFCSCHPGRDLARGSSPPLEKAGLGRAAAVVVVIGIPGAKLGKKKIKDKKLKDKKKVYLLCADVDTVWLGVVVVRKS